MARRPPAPRLCLDDAGSASEWRARRRDVGDGGERRGFAHARRAGVRGIAPRDRPLRSFSFTRRTAGGAEGVLNSAVHDVPSPLAGEGYVAVQRQDRVRGRAETPHPAKFAESPSLPSPARGEGTTT